MLKADDIFFIFVIANFALAFLFISTQLYFSYFRMNEILNFLSNSRGVGLRRPIMGRDPLTRFFMLISVGSMLTFYKRSLKGGDLDSEDYKKFPWLATPNDKALVRARTYRRSAFIFSLGTWKVYGLVKVKLSRYFPSRERRGE
ncbi:hypothetical protein NYP20_29235 [Pseudomonas sp. N3-W]|uniref:hypothetical protein n=1 Tax=Pseudomonas sp. N3-W TaxID=2975049 RepID=UPI00217D6792|nr:hypothetical protein [Pseudomonas sp. N3-W]UWF49321.1 hypothetical protein NYP20_29235 [Pseudomonas sp. N3-W]